MKYLKNNKLIRNKNFGKDNVPMNKHHGSQKPYLTG